MKKVIIALALAAVCSCMGPDHIGNADGNLPVYIEGTVSSEELDPLKHIRITVSLRARKKVQSYIHPQKEYSGQTGILPLTTSR